MNFLRLMWLACLMAASMAAGSKEAISEVEMTMQTKTNQEDANINGHDQVAMDMKTNAAMPSLVSAVAKVGMPQIEVVKMEPNAQEIQELLALDEAIETEGIEMETANKAEGVIEGAAVEDAVEENDEDENEDTSRSARYLKSETLNEESFALTDEEIAEIVKMVSFPTDDVSEHKEAHPVLSDNDNGKDNDKQTSTNKRISADIIEPRTENRDGRALRSRGYYILAFSPIEGPLVPYTKVDIIPAESAERSMLTDDEIRAEDRSDTAEETRMLGKNKWNSYIRRMMKQIRKGTRKIQRKTQLKSKKSDVTVENILRRLYHSRQKKPQSSWFKW